MSWNMCSRFGAGSDSDIVGFGKLEDAIGTNAWTMVDVREPHEFAEDVRHFAGGLNAWRMDARLSGGEPWEPST
jgi:hypothetical protein